MYIERLGLLVVVGESAKEGDISKESFIGEGAWICGSVRMSGSAGHEIFLLEISLV